MTCEVVSISGIEFHKLALTDAFGNPLLDDDDVETDDYDEDDGLDELLQEDQAQFPTVPPHVLKRRRSKQAGWVGYVVKQLSSWLTVYQQQPTNLPLVPELDDDMDDQELWVEWEWIVSETEKAARKWSEEEASRVKEELTRLRKSANLLKNRPIFLLSARQAILNKRFTPEELDALLATELDANKRSKIVSDVVSAFAEGWLKMLMEQFLLPKGQDIARAYAETYYEGSYQKGVVGGLKEVAWQASHGPGGTGLTHQVLGDILWALWKTLLSSVRFTLHEGLGSEDEELDAEGMKAMMEGVCGCQDSIIDLWYCTIRNSEFGAAREGMLPKRWAEEDREEKARIDEIKRQGVDARYEYQPFRRSSTSRETHIERQQLSELKRLLETSLHFYVVDK